MMTVHALIIEDHHDSIVVLGRLLEREGATFTIINEPQTLSPADLPAVDVVFLDLDMPEMDGYQVFDLLRREYGIQAPIIAYTVNTNEKATTRQLGFNGMLAKPLVNLRPKLSQGTTGKVCRGFTATVSQNRRLSPVL